MNELQKEKIKEFLKELTELSKKHEIYIGGCGCCGSPFLCTDNGVFASDLDFEEKTNSYAVYSHTFGKVLVKENKNEA